MESDTCTTKTNTKPIILHITCTGFGSEAILKEILKTQLQVRIFLHIAYRKYKCNLKYIQSRDVGHYTFQI